MESSDDEKDGHYGKCMGNGPRPTSASGTKFVDDVLNEMMVSEMVDIDVPFNAQEIQDTSQLRDSIAAEIWNDYVHDFPII
ncbi:hypothetical protein Ccrd_006938 [Cynara cardunculus var. scolymus]|uniref:Uncharacterized protein n=1 Tax=Cynara cardunculus var. scolymus TaxID=59895 RepID=A0A103XHY3_CYNCS|nr:hypothetical protein Ccrd_006938 [Cynara cardunculus var. scolymus]